MVDNINKNTFGETDAKIKLNALNELKNAEIKNKRPSSNQKELLKLFADLLKTISNNNNNNDNNNNNNNSNNSNNNSNNNENESDNVNDNGNGNENESESESESNNENDNDNVNVSESESGSEDENEDKNEEYCKIKQLKGYFKMIDETKSFEKQITLFKKK